MVSNRSQIYEKNRSRPRHGHRYINYKWNIEVKK